MKNTLRCVCVCWKTSSLKVDTQSLQNHSVVSMFQFRVIQKFKNDTGWQSTATIKRKEARQRNKEKKDRNHKGKNIHRTLFELETQTVHCARRGKAISVRWFIFFFLNFFIIIPKKCTFDPILFIWKFIESLSLCFVDNLVIVIAVLIVTILFSRFFYSVQVLVRKRPTHQMFPTKCQCLIENWWFLCVIQRQQTVICVLSRVWFDGWMVRVFWVAMFQKWFKCVEENWQLIN